ncbi:Tetrahydroberberine oxidase [Linum grandiflorum]
MKYLQSAAILLLFSFAWNDIVLASSSSVHENFIHCLSTSSAANVSKITFYTPSDPSYSAVLQFSIQNLRFINTSSASKPLVIVTPLTTSHVQSALLCSKKHNLHLRIRGGGHDYEGLSYVAPNLLPFFILDLINMSRVTVDVASRTAWVQGGATIGELYYQIGTRGNNTLAFPAGVCPTVGVGGHFSGGGYGLLLRKFGLAADHIVDAQLVDVEGRVLNRASMGEDHFWAIRGGGGNTFGIVTAWTVNLVPVPQTVTVFTVTHTTDKNATSKILEKWQQVADTLPDDLFIRVILDKSSSANVGRARFNSLYLGTLDVLLPLLRRRFPELGATREDLVEMSWAGYPTNSSLEVLRSRVPLEPIRNFKAKSDYVVKPIPEHAVEGVWRLIMRPGIEDPEIILSPYGGRMSEISDSSIPFPHRAGIRELYGYLAPHVSKNPRAAYVNYRDLDVGMNNREEGDKDEQEDWGVKYFKGNYKRLVHVKTVVDPTNFFRNEQSISPIYDD